MSVGCVALTKFGKLWSSSVRMYNINLEFKAMILLMCTNIICMYTFFHIIPNHQTELELSELSVVFFCFVFFTVGDSQNSKCQKSK